MLASDADARPPRALTPAFYGCFDWHSAVHSHWAIARLARRFPDAAYSADIAAALDRSLSDANLAGELDYLSAANRASFELPYGMAWLLVLCAELRGTRWAPAMRPLEDLAADRFATWLPALSHPIRSGEHSQSGFAMGLAHDWAVASGADDLRHLIERRARELYGADRDAPLAYEPSAYDFLSPALAEADLMRRVLPARALATWLDGFLPSLALAPVVPVDRADGKLVHFDGLNLSRAWMLRDLAAALPASDRRRGAFAALADAHGAAGMSGLSSNHYAGAHWLGSFALRWLDRPA